MDTTTPAMISPLHLAAHRNAELLRMRRANCHKAGYHGPLTRAELASQAAR